MSCRQSGVMTNNLFCCFDVAKLRILLDNCSTFRKIMRCILCISVSGAKKVVLLFVNLQVATLYNNLRFKVL